MLGSPRNRVNLSVMQPTKHIRPDRALIGVRVELLQVMQQPTTVSRLWDRKAILTVPRLALLHKIALARRKTDDALIVDPFTYKVDPAKAAYAANSSQGCPDCLSPAEVGAARLSDGRALNCGRPAADDAV